MNNYQRPPALPRAEVEAKCPAPQIAPHDDRGKPWHNPNTSGRLFGVTTGRYDALAVRSQQANLRRKSKEHSAIERSFRTTGLAFVLATRSGRK